MHSNRIRAKLSKNKSSGKDPNKSLGDKMTPSIKIGDENFTYAVNKLVNVSF